MNGFLPAELLQLSETIAQCRAQALIARQRAAGGEHYYRCQADRFQRLAAATRFPDIQASRLRIAKSYERLAEIAEGALGAPELRETAAQRREDRQIAMAALLALSRTLCEVTAALSLETREKLRHNLTADRWF